MIVSNSKDKSEYIDYNKDFTSFVFHKTLNDYVDYLDEQEVMRLSTMAEF